MEASATPHRRMDTIYLRTDLGNREIAERRHQLARWQRATLIVIGQGKSLAELEHAMRQMPEVLEQIVGILIALGLVIAQPPGHPTKTQEVSAQDPSKETRRYLGYLIGIIENANAAAALGLTIALKKADTLEAMQNLYSAFLDKLISVCGEAEAQRLLARLTPERAAMEMVQ